ncbi:GNAT family N-acetyltransferase [Salipiger mucosus]|uniref:BioF2-like acetyltransferase domain-containing protein n=1 Tax=Salipiger mucosus DSM 16094 TaxID=1123237 RepID=S9S6X0_9RHOB|nr:GNAT family N-acetyltransferase [Salipiger mucosus]EPX81964.1 hypothetical protein Salmuc_00278 [Salipiger mucosus DSM 16094]
MESLALPLLQSPQFARACTAAGIGLQRGGHDDAAGPVLRWQVQSRRLPGLGRVTLCSRGPVARAPGALKAWLDDPQAFPRGPLLLNADGLGAAELRAAGFWPLVTPATVALLPLGDPDRMRAAMHQKWRNRLNAAERQGVTLRRQPLHPDHWLLAAEQAQSRARRYRTLPPALSAVYAHANPGQALVWEAYHGGKCVAAIAVLRHGKMATWQMGVSRPEGRRCNAMNAALWGAMRWLARAGHGCLDLGILNSEDAPGLTRFKLGSGARAHRLGGTWLRSATLAPLARRLPLLLAK